jgi:nucleotide-binding universal stress UspA family protein
MFEKLLLAIDGSDHALHAASVAADMARNLNARELRIVVVYEAIPPYLGEPNLQYAINARMKDCQAILDKTTKEIGKIPGKLETELLEGPSAEAIIDVATTRKSDLIVMGSRGLGRLTGLLLGSTSQKVVSHAPCPVLIVR